MQERNETGGRGQVGTDGGSRGERRSRMKVLRFVTKKLFFSRSAVFLFVTAGIPSARRSYGNSA